MRLILTVGAVVATACAGIGRYEPIPPRLPFATDTLRSAVVRAGVAHWYIYAPSGPWAIHVLDVDLRRGYCAVAVKGFPGAIGREKTSTLLRTLDQTRDVIGGVNADFFLFTPPGVPTNAMITGGRVITGPNVQPVFAIDANGAPTITTLRGRGTLTIGTRRLPIAGWNRPQVAGIALMDPQWGPGTDTATSAVEVQLSRRNPDVVAAIDTATAGVTIPAGGAVLIAGRNAPDSIKHALRALRPGDTLRVDVALTPIHPREAVGGRPVLVRDSMIVGEVDSVGGPGFATGRHPRTAVGIARGGTRLMLAVVDGRQPPYSAGMSLRELANLMLGLGARDAINLDGGGSTAFVFADPDSAGTLRVANRPSDPTGERAVANALAIVAGC